MKKLIFINGEPGVGKTTVCKALYKELDKSVWLDGDWCWMMNPFNVTEENKKMVVDNIVHMLRNFLNNSSFDYVVFNWVMPKEYIFKLVEEGIKDLEYEMFRISLLCSPNELLNRRIVDGREPWQLKVQEDCMDEYHKMDTIKLYTEGKSIENVVGEIKRIIS